MVSNTKYSTTVRTCRRINTCWTAWGFWEGPQRPLTPPIPSAWHSNSPTRLPKALQGTHTSALPIHNEWRLACVDQLISSAGSFSGSSLLPLGCLQRYVSARTTCVSSNLPALTLRLIKHRTHSAFPRWPRPLPGSVPLPRILLLRQDCYQEDVSLAEGHFQGVNQEFSSGFPSIGFSGIPPEIQPTLVGF